MYLVLASKEDAASMNIRRFVLEGAEWEEVGEYDDSPVHHIPGRATLATIEDMHLNSDDLDVKVSEALDMPMPENVIFLSRHKSGSGLRTLTVHPIGCYGKADFGGRERTLVPSAPGPMTVALRFVHAKAKAGALDFKVSFETTHHGPYLETPTFFIEIGSTEEAWVEEGPARVLASTVLEIVLCKEDITDQLNDPVVLGVGGGHYAPRFTDVALAKKVSFGHMVPTYALEGITDEALLQAFERTPGVKMVYFHRKALKGDIYRRAKDLLVSAGLEVVREKDLEDICPVP